MKPNFETYKGAWCRGSLHNIWRLIYIFYSRCCFPCMKLLPLGSPRHKSSRTTTGCYPTIYDSFRIYGSLWRPCKAYSSNLNWAFAFSKFWVQNPVIFVHFIYYYRKIFMCNIWKIFMFNIIYQVSGTHTLGGWEI